MISQLYNNSGDFLVKSSRPSHYPTPDRENLLFFIQRNGSLNTVVYELNVKNNKIDPSDPMNIYWIKYSCSGEEMALNYIQHKLAYGYKFEFINEESFEFRMVCYDKKKFFVGRDNYGQFRVITNIDGESSYLDCVYAVVDERGVFPDVKYVELWGKEIRSNYESYEKIVF